MIFLGFPHGISTDLAHLAPGAAVGLRKLGDVEMSICMCVTVYVCMYVCMYVYIYYIYICMYIIYILYVGELE